MKLVRKKKLQRLFIISLTLSVVVGLVLYALRQNISLFYTPSEIAEGQAPFGPMIRAGGVVVVHSIRHPKASREVEFKITDFQHALRVHYRGILPDLFREGQGVVVQGHLLNTGLLSATTVLAKHDENYQPPELRNRAKR